MFKIRRKKDGKFSSGGVYPTFVEHGFRWQTFDQLRGHIDFAIGKQPAVYRGCEIIEVEEVFKRTVSPFELVDRPKGRWDR